MKLVDISFNKKYENDIEQSITDVGGVIPEEERHLPYLDSIIREQLSSDGGGGATFLNSEISGSASGAADSASARDDYVQVMGGYKIVEYHGKLVQDSSYVDSVRVDKAGAAEHAYQDAVSASKQYTDQVVSSASSGFVTEDYVDEQISASLSTSKEYTDQAADEVLSSSLETSKDYTDTQVSSSINTAKSYTDTQISTSVSQSNNYTDTKTTEVLSSSKDYTDTQVSSSTASAKGYTDTKSAETLSSSKDYTDTQVSSSVSAVKGYADSKSTEAISASKDYTDTKSTEAISASKDYTDTKSTEILSSSKEYADTQVSSSIDTAKGYTDTKSSEAISSSKDHTDTQVSASLSQSKAYTDTKSAETLSSSMEYANTASAAAAAIAVSESKQYTDDALAGFSGSVSKEYVDEAVSASLSESKQYTDDALAGFSGSVSKEYVDEAVSGSTTAAKNYADSKSAEAISSSNDYTDTQVSESISTVKDYADSKSVESVSSSKDYTDTQVSTSLSQSKEYADSKSAEAISSSNDYTDTQVSTSLSQSKEYADSKSAEAISSSNDYTDTQVSTSLSQSKTYTDTALSNSNFKSKQTPYSQSAGAGKYIAIVEQNENGEIVVHSEDLPEGATGSGNIGTASSDADAWKTIVHDAALSSDMALSGSVKIIPAATTVSDGYMTTAYVTKLNSIESGSAPNQNAFSSVVVNNESVSASSETDSITIVAGDYVNITPNTTSKTITIAGRAITGSVGSTGDEAWKNPIVMVSASGRTVTGSYHGIPAATSVNDGYMTALHVQALENKQDELVSGENIKTVNSQSLVGPGNVDIPLSPITSSSTVHSIVVLEESEYEALPSPDAETLYILTPDS